MDSYPTAEELSEWFAAHRAALIDDMGLEAAEEAIETSVGVARGIGELFESLLEVLPGLEKMAQRSWELWAEDGWHNGFVPYSKWIANLADWYLRNATIIPLIHVLQHRMRQLQDRGC